MKHVNVHTHTHAYVQITHTHTRIHNIHTHIHTSDTNDIEASYSGKMRRLHEELTMSEAHSHIHTHTHMYVYIHTYIHTYIRHQRHRSKLLGEDASSARGIDNVQITREKIQRNSS